MGTKNAPKDMITELQNTIIFTSSDNKTSLSVQLDTNTETVWLSLNQLAYLFNRDKSVISRHLKNVFNEGEIDRNSAVAKNATTATDGKTYEVEYFNLDAILSVGYRVNSKRGTEFRRWSSQILKDYLIRGYSHNKEALLRSGFADVSRSLDILKKSLLSQGYTDEIGHATIDLIRVYSKSWTVLNAYDEDKLTFSDKNFSYKTSFTDKFCLHNIQKMKDALMSRSEASSLFGNQREHGLSQILGSIHQTFSGNLLYPSVYERAAHLFYFTLKDHPFVDGNKRIGCFLLLLYLSIHSISLAHITNESLVALALLVAQSDPSDKDIIVKLILNLIAGEK